MEQGINTKQLFEILRKSIPANKTILITGAPGVGKTQVVEQVSSYINYNFLPPLYPATLQEIEIAGMPMPIKTENSTKLVRLMDELLQPAFDAKENSVLLIDEFSEGSHAVQAAFAPLIRERKIGKNKLPDCVSIILASNKREHKTGGNLILTHLISRMTSVVNLIVDTEIWLHHAIKQKIRPEITSFIKIRPSLLNCFDADDSFQNCKPYPNPRSWFHVNDLLNLEYSKDLEYHLYSGAVGEGAAREFCSHLPIFREQIDLFDIVNNKRKFTFPKAEKLAERWAFTFGVGSIINLENSERVFEIANILFKDKNSEYAKVIISQALTVFPEICSSQIFFDFCKSPLGESFQNQRIII